MENQIIMRVILFIIILISMYTDFKERKIYNYVTFSGIALGLVLNYTFYGVDGLQSSLISMGVAFLVVFVFYLLKQFGAGDVKLILAMCALENVFFIFGGMIIGTSIAAIYAVYLWIKTRNRKATLPYAVFIGIGMILYQVGLLCF